MGTTDSRPLTILLVLGAYVLSGAAGHAVAQRKRRGPGLLLGLWLGPLGLLLMWVIEPKRGTPPVTKRWYDRADVVLSLFAVATAGLALAYGMAGG